MMTKTEAENIEMWLNRWSSFQAMENEYIKSLLPIAYEMAMVTVNNYTPKGKNWTYRRLCTGEIISDEKRLSILRQYENSLMEAITQPDTLFFGDPIYIRSQLFEMGCFILSWLEIDWTEPEEYTDSNIAKKKCKNWKMT